MTPHVAQALGDEETIVLDSHEEDCAVRAGHQTLEARRLWEAKSMLVPMKTASKIFAGRKFSSPMDVEVSGAVLPGP